MSQRKFSIVGESNDGYLGGDDGEDPPWVKTKKSHAWPSSKKKEKSEFPKRFRIGNF